MKSPPFHFIGSSLKKYLQLASIISLLSFFKFWLRICTLVEKSVPCIAGAAFHLSTVGIAHEPNTLHQHDGTRPSIAARTCRILCATAFVALPPI